VIDIATSTAASARFVPAALWSHLAYPISPKDPLISELAPAYSTDRNISKLLAAIVAHPRFQSAPTLNGLIKQPIEYVVGALRAVSATAAEVRAKQAPMLAVLAGLGQIPFNPPSVGGWGQNSYWLSTAAALIRWQFAERLSATADISLVSDAPPRARVDAAAQLLSIPTWSSTTAKALAGATSSPPHLVALALVSPEFVSN
jgi:uncharacterized protein (DUF1800 family)